MVHAFPLSQKVYALQAIAGTRRDEEWKPRPELCNVDTERDLADEKGSASVVSLSRVVSVRQKGRTCMIFEEREWVNVDIQSMAAYDGGTLFYYC